MKLFVPKEREAGEPRVAASPDSIKKLKALGFDVIVESGAGNLSRIPDDAFTAAGATIGSASDAASADLILKVRRPGADELDGYRKLSLIHI